MSAVHAVINTLHWALAIGGVRLLCLGTSSAEGAPHRHGCGLLLQGHRGPAAWLQLCL